VTDLARWRGGLFTAGWILLFVGGVGLPVASMRSSHLLATRSYELSVWIFGGLLFASASLVFVLFGIGWKRWALTACALVEMYLWLSFMLWMVQMA